MPGFQSVSAFLSDFLLAKLTTTSIGVNEIVMEFEMNTKCTGKYSLPL